LLVEDLSNDVYVQQLNMIHIEQVIKLMLVWDFYKKKMNMLMMMMDLLDYMETNNVILVELVHSNQHHVKMECLIQVMILMLMMMRMMMKPIVMY
jgi:Cdc6-like AAA superfamily ATPase